MIDKADGKIHVALMIVTVSAVAACMGLLGVLARQKDRRAPIAMITYNLIQLGAAKDAWAKEHGVTGAVYVTEQELVPYLWSGRAKGELVKPVVGELYKLNRLGMSPEAQLTRRVGSLPRGTVLSLNPTNTLPLEVSLPGTTRARERAY